VAGIGEGAGGLDADARALLSRELRREVEHQLRQLRELELRVLVEQRARELRELELRELELRVLVEVVIALDLQRRELVEKLRTPDSRATVGEGGDLQPTSGEPRRGPS
jgi:hypothetical protein